MLIFVIFDDFVITKIWQPKKKTCPYSECCTTTNTKKWLITCSHPVLPFLWISIPLQRGILVLLAHDSRYTFFFFLDGMIGFRPNDFLLNCWLAILDVILLTVINSEWVRYLAGTFRNSILWLDDPRWQ